MTFWTIVGWLIFGGAFGYATERWRVVYVVISALFGLSLIVQTGPPELLLGVSENGSWAETIAFVGGLVIGGRIAKHERTVTVK